MDKKKVRQTIKVLRVYKKAGPDEAIPAFPENGEQALLEALEEIASVDNIEALRKTLSGIKSGIITERLAKLHGLMVSVQVPKEVIYAYPVTMTRHFRHYASDWLAKSVPVSLYHDGKIVKDDFGCEWQKFSGPKELVDYLRENNIPIKVIE